MKGKLLFPSSEGPLIVAHRGAAESETENTVAAFEEALRQGADGLELDVRMTADGVPVVFHDADGLRLAGTPWKIDSIRAEDLSSFRLAGGHEIPRFEEILRTFGTRTILDIEVKEKAAVLPIVKLLTETGLVERVLVTSFDRFVVRQVKQLLPQVKTGLIMGRRTWNPRIRMTEAFPLPWLIEAQTDAAILHYRLCNRPLLALLRIMGYPVISWAGLEEEIQNPEPYFSACRTLPLQGIATVFPARMRASRWGKSQYHLLENDEAE